MNSIPFAFLTVLGACALACGGSHATQTTGGTGGAGGQAATTATATGSGGGSSSSTGSASSGGSGTLAAKYPCDKGIAADPAVVWSEDFEEGSVALATSRYDSANNPPGMALVADVPFKSCGKASMKFTSGVSANATDLYKQLPATDELFVRWYAKYQAGIQWHHTGMWFGGYNPPTAYPNPQAGLKPQGDDRFSISIEPVYGVGAADPRLDYYNYWMAMHSWMDMPMGSTAYYGNSLVHRNAFTADDDQWMCLEVHVKLNTDLSSSAGAELDVWKNDALVQHFDAQAPAGCWIKDKFCASDADGDECTAYPDLCKKPSVPLDLQYRSTTP